MNEIPTNPFIEGSVQVPDEEVAAAAKALAEEAALVRSKADEIKERAAKARAEKEAARKAEIARMEAEVEAARAQVIKTVASIPKASDRPTIRPVPPNIETTGSDSKIASESDIFSSFYNPSCSLSLATDIVLTLITVTFTFLIFNNL